MQILRPRLKFLIHLHVERNNKTSIESATCFAESYEIQSDGSITFFQIAKTHDDKKIRIPVLSYPKGKWEACILLDDNNNYPVFNKGSLPLKTDDSDSNINQGNRTAEDEISKIDTVMGTNIVPSYHLGQNHHTPGVNPGNQQEFNQKKDAWLEQEIRHYVKNNDHFILDQFYSYLKSQPQFKSFKPQETEITWLCSKLIRNKQLMSKKFHNQQIQKVLGLILPDIMKRQWDGKMSPILQVLEEREETKNVTAIDVAVWMVQFNFE